MLRYPKIMADFYVTNFIKFSLDKITKRNIWLDHAKKTGASVARPFIPNEEFNEVIKKKLDSNEPFFCCRYGNSELTACFYALLRKRGILDNINSKLLKTAKSGPGVFPEKEDVYLKFADTYVEALGNADMNAYWGNVLREEFMIRSYIKKDCTQYAMRALEPFQYDNPWTNSILGRSVLVIHPFAELIESQYKKRDTLFPGKRILPDCDLKTVKAIQSSGETVPQEFQNWNDALDALYE